MSLVSVHNEWDPLEEIIVGTARGAQFPDYDRSFHATFYEDYSRPEDVPTGKFGDRVIEETEEDLAEFVETLQKLGITVRRPKATDLSRTFGAPGWQSNGFYNYCPRDILLAINDTVIETPSPVRARYLEAHAYHEIYLDYLQSGSRWISAPRPRLDDSLYDLESGAKETLQNHEPAFDAANVLRMGKDLLYLVSNTGNEFGALWLQNTLGSEYRIHLCRDLYKHTHIDTTLVLIRPGLVLINPSRVTDDNLPEVLQRWDKLVCPEIVDTGFEAGWPPCASVWIGMNFIMVNPQLAIIDKKQIPLIKAVESKGIEVIPLQLRHARTLGGSFHCMTLDTRREGTLESYVD